MIRGLARAPGSPVRLSLCAKQRGGPGPILILRLICTKLPSRSHGYSRRRRRLSRLYRKFPNQLLPISNRYKSRRMIWRVARPVGIQRSTRSCRSCALSLRPIQNSSSPKKHPCKRCGIVRAELCSRSIVFRPHSSKIAACRSRSTVNLICFVKMFDCTKTSPPDVSPNICELFAGP